MVSSSVFDENGDSLTPSFFLCGTETVGPCAVRDAGFPVGVRNGPNILPVLSDSSISVGF